MAGSLVRWFAGPLILSLGFTNIYTTETETVVVKH
jgi:hypothetical protein